MPPGTLELADAFYGKTLGLHRVSVPALQKGKLAWFDITPKGQQIHIALGRPTDFEHESGRHPCFRLETAEDLLQLQKRIWEHYETGDVAAPKMVDKPGEDDSGSQGVEFPKRFFARDFAGNRLEFSL